MPVSYFRTLVIALAILSSHADAGVITSPSGLQQGDTYRLVFITSSVRDATSSNIDDYNAFVQLVAESVPALSALGATWKAAVATDTVDLTANLGAIPASTPIYRLDGAEISDGFIFSSGLFPAFQLQRHSSEAPTLTQLPVLFDENAVSCDPSNLGFSASCYVWTGTFAKPLGLHLGGPFGAYFGDGYGGGDLSLADAFLYPDDRGTITGADPADLKHLYAISSDLTFSGPEPGTMSLLALGGTLLLLLRQKGANTASLTCHGSRVTGKTGKGELRRID